MSEPKTNETQDNDSNVSRLINEETRPLDIKNYSNWTKEELIAEINKLKKRKKYGIVWEEKEEIVVKESEAKLPVLNELANLSLIFEPRFQTDVLIEGDNYHALSVLNYTHKGKIDAIYIDPPFNTGARNWKYNNDYVDKNDTFRHSKWISMMEKRLKLAKPLLKDDGVLICAIDENELWHLGMLLEELFFDREVHLITIVHNPRGVQGENFSYVNEFAFFVIPKHKKIISTRKLKQDEIYWSNLRNWGGESDRTDAKNCFYPIIVKGSEIIDFGEVATADYHPPQQTEVRGDLSYVWPIDVKGNEKKWRYARQSVEEIKDILRVRKSNKGRIEIEIGKDYGIVRTVWQDTKYDAAEYGTKLIHALVPGNDFEFSKSVYTVYDCLASVVSDRKNAIVLDFFAGSGTTGHAVIMLNKNDGGSRRFILCTNNENNIAVEVCYPRVKKVIEGDEQYKNITGFDANLKYFQTDFISNVSTDYNKKKLVARSTEMLCLKENCFCKESEGRDFRIYSGNDDKMLSIIYDDNGIEECKAILRKLNRKVVVYIFSLDDSNKEEDFIDINNLVEIKPIPASILNVYRRLFG